MEKNSCHRDIWIKNITKTFKQKIHLKKIRSELIQKLPTNHSLDELSKIIDEKLRSKFSTQAYQTIKKITVILPYKRDGGLMKFFID